MEEKVRVRGEEGELVCGRDKRMKKGSEVEEGKRR